MSGIRGTVHWDINTLQNKNSLKFYVVLDSSVVNYIFSRAN